MSQPGTPDSKEMLAQLEEAQRDLVRALEMLDEPAEGPIAPSSIVPKRGAEDDRQFKQKVLEHLKALRESLADDEARAQSVLHERDAEIIRLRKQLEELQSHHILPPLAFKYEPSTPPEKRYDGPLKLPLELPPAPQPFAPSWESMTAAEQHQAEQDLSRVVVTYMIDGSDKYTPMTVHAIESLINSTPNVNIGIVAHDIEFARNAVSGLTGNFHFVPSSIHFDHWNPTQFKLDILQFSDVFDTIMWLDSDTFVYRDLRPTLLQFHRSDKPFALMPDLVMHDSGFRQRWSGDPSRVFVAQASMMGFKSGPMQQLFAVWENKWREWIVPHPFANFKDPMPDFEGSAFCIEQYALGMALEELMEDAAREIFMFDREQVFLQLLDDGTIDVYAVPFSYAMGIAGISGMSSYGSARLLTLSMTAGINTSARVVYQGSYRGSYAGSSGLTLAHNSHMIDNVSNAVLHLYNTNYHVVYTLVKDHRQEILDRLQHHGSR